MVRRGRNETDSGGTVTRSGNRFRDLVTGQLTTLTRLGTLGDLDLELVSVREVA